RPGLGARLRGRLKEARLHQRLRPRGGRLPGMAGARSLRRDHRDRRSRPDPAAAARPARAGRPHGHPGGQLLPGVESALQGPQREDHGEGHSPGPLRSNDRGDREDAREAGVSQREIEPRGGILPDRAASRPSRIVKTFRAFTYRDYRLLWAGAFTSSVGTWMQEVAQNWLILTMTGSAFLLGLDAFLGDAPFLAFSLFGGVL